MKKMILRTAEKLGYQIVKIPPQVAYAPPRIVAYGPVPEARDLNEAERHFRQRQCVIIRKAIDPDWIRDYRGVCEAFVRQLDGMTALRHDHPHVKIYAAQNTISFESARDDGMLMPANFQNIVYRIKDSGLLNLGHRLYGEPCAILLQNCSMKRQRPDEPVKGLGFHQDSPVITKDQNPIPGFVIWVPITPVNAETPGLEIVTEPAYTVGEFTINPTNGFLEALPDDPTVTGAKAPVSGLDDGDVLLFSLMVPHRTRVTEGMTKTRISFDIRVVPLSAVPADYSGLKIL